MRIKHNFERKRLIFKNLIIFIFYYLRTWSIIITSSIAEVLKKNFETNSQIPRRSIKDTEKRVETDDFRMRTDFFSRMADMCRHALLRYKIMGAGHAFILTTYFTWRLMFVSCNDSCNTGRSFVKQLVSSITRVYVRLSGECSWRGQTLCEHSLNLWPLVFLMYYSEILFLVLWLHSF